MLTRLLDILLGRKCHLCGARGLDDDADYCNAHYPAEVAQHQEMNR